MITNSIVDSTTTEDGMRMIKVDQFGAKEPYECSPYGFDSNPVKDMTAIYADTSENGEPIIIGYVNENQLAEVGELRLYNSEQGYIWIKKDDSIELNGNARTIVAFQNLKTELENTISKLNAELTKIQYAITGLGGTYPKVDVSIDIDSSEVKDVKVK